MENAPRPTDTGLFLRMIGVPLIWGAAFVPAKIAVHDLSPGMAAFARYVVASLTLIIASWWLEGGLPRPRGRQWIGLLLLGLSGICVYNLLLFKSMESLTPARGALIIALSPALIAVGASALQREAMGLRRWFGVALALAGAWIVLSHGNVANIHLGLGAGEGYMLGAVGCWVSYTLISRKVLANGLSIIATTTWSSLLGTLMLLPMAVLAWPRMGDSAHAAKPWIAVALMGLFGTGVAFLWYAEGIRRLGSAHAAVFTNLVPVFAVAASWAFLGEKPDFSLVAGGAVTLAGVFLVNATGHKKPRARAQGS